MPILQSYEKYRINHYLLNSCPPLASCGFYRGFFYPGKIFKTTLDDMSITRRAELDTDYTDGSSNNGSGSVKPNPGGDGGKGDEEAPDPTV